MRRLVWSAALLVTLVASGPSLTQTATADTGKTPASSSTSSRAFVGGDLHTLTVTDSTFIVTGHQSGSISRDGGATWKPIDGLDGADVMGWATSASRTYAAGHTSLYSAALTDETFSKVALPGDITDVHSVGAFGKYVYLASPQAGFIASNDDGKTWEIRNTNQGLGFMGSMLVDPKNLLRVLAPDMQSGLLETKDGGLTWSALGGPMGTMSIAWNAKDTNTIAVIGMGSAGLTHDGGKTWSELSLPDGASAIAISNENDALFVASLNGQYAEILKSSDAGKSWISVTPKDVVSSSSPHDHEASPGMDPNMPGMDHSNAEVVSRPLGLIIGIFGLATFLVLVVALVLRRKDASEKARKTSSRARSLEKK